MPTKFVVFFRNLNLGHPPAPTRAVFEAAFADAGAVAGVSLPSTNPRGDVRVVSWHDGMLLSLTYKLGASAGSPNAFVERTLDVPATTRVWNTVVRLVRKHAATQDP